jgi:DNA-binding NarL/FixJ family response regulator
LAAPQQEIAVGVRVLIVEDSQAVRDSLADLLALAGGYAVAGSADTDAAAIAWLQAHPTGCDLVICDLELREGSGLQVLQAIARLPRRPQVVVFSEQATGAMAVQCRRLGAAAIFAKSDVAALVDWLDRHPGQMGLPFG